MILLSGDERLPLYQRLAETLRRDIVGRRWRPGDQLPSENVIAEDYQVAPGTVRQALQQLVREGLVERFHGKGTFVRRPTFDQTMFRFFRFRGPSINAVVPESRILRRTVEPAPSRVAQQLQFREGEDAIHISRLRLVDGQPLVAEEIWLPLNLFAAFMDIPVGDVPPLLYPTYDAHCGQAIVRAEEELTAELASRETARLLRVEPGAAVIVIDRLAYGFDGTPLEWRRSRGRADQFHYHTEIR